MNSDDKLIERFSSLIDEHRKRFGVKPPLEEMSGDLQEDIEALEKALADGKPYEADIPPGAVT